MKIYLNPYRISLLLLLSYVSADAQSKVAASYDKTSDTLKIFYANNVHQLDDYQKETVKAFAKNHLDASYIVLGYADATGSAASNQLLSRQRAMMIKSFLLDERIIPERIDARSGAENVKTDQRINKRVALIICQHKNTEPNRFNTLKSLKTGQTLELSEIHFVGGTAEFLKGSYECMKSLSEALKANQNIHIQIEGHICCNPDANKTPYVIDKTNGTSVDRARAVYNMLIRLGIDSNRMKYVGFGASTPKVNPERTEEDRKKNRRVEIRVISK